MIASGNQHTNIFYNSALPKLLLLFFISNILHMKMEANIETSSLGMYPYLNLYSQSSPTLENILCNNSSQQHKEESL